MLTRILEPEIMDTAEEARDYDAMDHGAVNAQFSDDFLRFASSGTGETGWKAAIATRATRILDIGTGTALIPIALCQRAAGFEVIGVDLADHMLALARANIVRAGLESRVRVQRADAKGTAFEDGSFGATVSNSIVHHIPSPREIFAEICRVTAPGGVVFVRDLHRPETEAEVARLVALHAGEPPAEASERGSYESQRELLRASLCASLTVEEVAEMVAPLGIPKSAIAKTSDRHWTLAWEKR